MANEVATQTASCRHICKMGVAMPGPRPIDRLLQVRDAVESLAAAGLMPADLAEWFIEGIDEFLNEAASGLDLARALGLSKRGGCAWRHEEALRQRNGIIRDLHEQYYSSQPLPDAIKAIHLLAIRYQAASARRDAAKAEADLVADGRRRLIAAALRTGRPFPGPKQLRTILRNPMAD